MSLNSNRHAYVHICKLINLYLKLLLKISDLHLMFRIIFEEIQKKSGFPYWKSVVHAHSRQLFTGHLYDACT